MAPAPATVPLHPRRVQLPDPGPPVRPRPAVDARPPARAVLRLVPTPRRSRLRVGILPGHRIASCAGSLAAPPAVGDGACRGRRGRGVAALDREPDGRSTRRLDRLAAAAVLPALSNVLHYDNGLGSPAVVCAAGVCGV